MKFETLESRGVLGMNWRNAEIIAKNNPRKLYPLVDDKLKTKELLEKHHLPTPELYFKISGNYELRMIKELKFLREFVVKPARGAEGRGILVIVDRQEKEWLKASGERYTAEALQYHASNILAGLYSLGGTDDQAFIEYRVRSHAVFKNHAYQGVPDIRLILYKGIPLMGMLRLPTKKSDGRANLHQGAVGVGIRLKNGHTFGGVHLGSLADIHPDTQKPLAGLAIPFWDQIMEIAAKIYDVFHLGYIGVDFVIDHLLGPMILELNARPGLSIQLANRQGLLRRLTSLDRILEASNPRGWEERLILSERMLTDCGG